MTRRDLEQKRSCDGNTNGSPRSLCRNAGLGKRYQENGNNYRPGRSDLVMIARNHLDAQLQIIGGVRLAFELTVLGRST